MSNLQDHLLEITGKLHNEEQLEPNDEAQYEIKVKNISNWKVTDLSIWAHEDSDPNINLTAGHQVFPDIEPGQEKTRLFKVTCTGPVPGNYSITLDVRYKFKAQGEFQPFGTVPLTVSPD